MSRMSTQGMFPAEPIPVPAGRVRRGCVHTLQPKLASPAIESRRRDQEQMPWRVEMRPPRAEQPELERMRVRGRHREHPAGFEVLGGACQSVPWSRKMLDRMPHHDGAARRQGGEHLVGTRALERIHVDDRLQILDAAAVHLDGRHIETGVSRSPGKDTEAGSDLDEAARRDPLAQQLDLLCLASRQLVELPGVRKPVVAGWVEAPEICGHVREEDCLAAGAATVGESLIADAAVSIGCDERSPAGGPTQRTRRVAGGCACNEGGSSARQRLTQSRGNSKSRYPRSFSEIVRSPVTRGHSMPNAGSSQRTPRAASGT